LNDIVSSLLHWFSLQSLFVQFTSVSAWSFACGLLVASFFLWLFFQKQKRDILERQETIFHYERKLLEERAITSLRFVEKNKEQSLLIAELREREAGQRSEISSLEVRLAQEQLRTEEKLDLLQGAREQLRLQFEELAANILEEKSAHFGRSSEEKLGNLLTPFHEQLSSFRKKIDAIHHNETRDRAALQQEITGLKELNQRMSDDAKGLSRALKGDKRIQGTWGELVLERVLEQSALRKGVEYETQATFRDKDNRLQRPDVLVHLPEGRDIIIDSKVSLVSWERYVNCDDNRKQEEFLKLHVKSIRDHITTLGRKDYSALPAIRSLDFVLLFMPVEAAFVTAFQKDEKLFSDAVARKIILVSPTTLLTTLRTVESIWSYEKQSRNAREIAERAAALYDKFCAFTEDMERIGKQMNSMQNSYDSAMTRLCQGRGNLVSRVECFPQMGVKVKKAIPKSIATQAEL
jgi:DNA recombination protein RmuC